MEALDDRQSLARVQHPQDADADEAMLKPELLPGISKVPGYCGSCLLRRTQDAEIEFITIMFWDSIEAIRAVAGPDYEAAVVLEQRRQHLTRWDQRCSHYEVAATHQLDSIPL